MNYSIKNLKERAIPLPITQEALMIAQIFAKEQPTVSKQRQVYLNTLAVCIVNNYIEMRQIPSDLKASDSWHPAIRLCADVSDLKLTELGHLECRPVKPVSLNETVNVLCDLPEEMPGDRIGCIIVEIDEVKRRANLLGFTKTVSGGKLYVTQLSHMDDFGEYLEELGAKDIEQSKELVHLSNWLQNSFEPAWQSFQALLGTSKKNLALGMRSNSQLSEINIRRANIIDLGFSLGSQSVALVVAIVEQIEQQVCVVVQVYPLGEVKYVPHDLRLVIHSESLPFPKEIRARSRDLCIQTNRFWCEPGEKFSIQVALNEFSVMEHFIV